MNGETILRAVVDERLRELDAAPAGFRERAGGSVYGFCLGAADGLAKAGLLTPEQQRSIMESLAAELARRGLGQQVSETVADMKMDDLGRSGDVE